MVDTDLSKLKMATAYVFSQMWIFLSSRGAFTGGEIEFHMVGNLEGLVEKIPTSLLVKKCLGNKCA